MVNCYFDFNGVNFNIGNKLILRIAFGGNRKLMVLGLFMNGCRHRYNLGIFIEGLQGFQWSFEQN